MCFLIGVFPPPYGGVSVKNELFCGWLQEHRIRVSRVDCFEIKRSKKKIPALLLTCIKAFCSKETVIYGLDWKRLRALIGLQSLFPKSYERTIILAMGGKFPQIIGQYPLLLRHLKKVREIWVETYGMKTNLEQMGFSNVEVFPNPRSEKGSCEPKTRKPQDPLRLVFFSQISEEKGVKDIMELVPLLNRSGIDYTLDFYGHMVPQFQQEFEQFVEQSPGVNYCGVFDSAKAEVYRKLNEYDILLFPTHWDTEGVPGILVEAKMAGIAVIASARSYNGEQIRVDKDEGFLLYENYPEEMFEMIQQCANNRKLLQKMKQGSFASRKRYALEEYEKMLERI